MTLLILSTDLPLHSTLAKYELSVFFSLLSRRTTQTLVPQSDFQVVCLRNVKVRGKIISPTTSSSDLNSSSTLRNKPITLGYKPKGSIVVTETLKSVEKRKPTSTPSKAKKSNTCAKVAKFYVNSELTSVHFCREENYWLESCELKNKRELKNGKWFKHGDDIWFSNQTRNHEWKVDSTFKNCSITVLQVPFYLKELFFQCFQLFYYFINNCRLLDIVPHTQSSRTMNFKLFSCIFCAY